MKHIVRVGVLRGGPSNEYEVSLDTGSSVLTAIRKHHEHIFVPKDIFIDRKGIWHIDGIPFLPEDLYTKVDVVFNALHGNYGEDGKIQSFLETHGIPFTGSKSLGSAIGMNKSLTKKILNDHGIKSPYWTEIASQKIRNLIEPEAKKLFNSFVFPAVVKPNSSGSSVGVSIVRTFPELMKALSLAIDHGEHVIIEEYIPGIEATCGVIENFRDQKLYALPPVEIRPHGGFFDYEAKYQNKSEEIVPANFSEDLKKSIEDLSKQIHHTLGLRHYSRSDFIIHPKRGIYALEVNTLPGLTQESLIPKSLRAIGSDIHELVEHLINLALKNK